jgi:hypothetical protein
MSGHRPFRDLRLDWPQPFEVLEQFYYEHARRMSVLADMGCTVCGDPATVLIEWPKHVFSVSLDPGALRETRTITITEEVRFLCEMHARA